MNNFVNRTREVERITRAVSVKKGTLIVIYGRRRCGKYIKPNNALLNT
jgi:AAA+ ATPase superfamily predicted ATPase